MNYTVNLDYYESDYQLIVQFEASFKYDEPEVTNILEVNIIIAGQEFEIDFFDKGERTKKATHSLEGMIEEYFDKWEPNSDPESRGCDAAHAERDEAL